MLRIGKTPDNNKFKEVLVNIVTENKSAQVKHYEQVLNTDNTKCMTKVEHSIDLRKEKPMSETNDIVAVDPRSQAALDIQNQLIAQTQVPKKLPALKAGEQQISVIIDMKLMEGDDNFMEVLKLGLVSNINSVICNACKHTKSAAGYTINKVKVNTEIICR